MEIRVHEKQKLVEVWLTNKEQTDIALQQRLKPIYRQYKETGYQVAVFRSGSGDLYEQTYSLLHFNRKRIAQLDMQKEKMIRSPQ